jgi:SAM-dependent MidA family methyltransferase
MNNINLINELKTLIINKGNISIAKFMNLALYNEKYGYYSSNITNIGKYGDFVTSVSSSILFAKSLVNQIKEIFIHNLDKNIIEIGAGNGQLMLDILYLIGDDIDKYYIIEKSQKLIDMQKNRLLNNYPQYYNKVIWLNDYNNFSLNGIIIANEVLDALICNQYQLINGNIYENMVTIKDDNFVILPYAISEVQNNKILHRIKPYNLPNYFTFEMAEVSLDKFFNMCNNLLKSGCLLLIDYGYSEKELFTLQHSKGTLRGFKNHQLVENILDNIGFMDITYSVNFTQVAEFALKNKFDIIDYTNQAHFLINCGLLDLLSNNLYSIDSKEYLLNTNMVDRLTSFNQMGEIFKVIGLCKNYNFYDWLGFQKGTLAHAL